MRIAIGLLLFCAFQSTVQAFAGAVSAFSGCAILERHSWPSGKIAKIYDCAGVGVELAGEWTIKQDRGDLSYYWEFGEPWLGERDDFGSVAASFIKHRFTKCTGGFFGSRSNFDGYMSLTLTFQCAEAEVALTGMWGEEYQGHWNYNLHLGEVASKPQWTDDVEKLIDFSRSFQKWCQTKYGYRLCGWVEEPKVDHGKPPAFRRDK